MKGYLFTTEVYFQMEDEVIKEQVTEEKTEITKEEKVETPAIDTEALRKTFREEWERERAEAERVAKLTQKEREVEQQKLREAEIQARERVIQEKELQIALRDEMTLQGLDLALKDLFVADRYIGKENSSELLKGDIENVKNIINNIVEKQIEAYKNEYLKGETPKGLDAKPQAKSQTALDLILNKLK